MTTYAESGVNTEWGNDASKILYNASKETWKNRAGKLGEVITPTDSFSGVRAIRVGGLPETTVMNIGFDGVGTKIELAERMQRHDTVAHDLFAMVCDDAVVRGAEPVLIGSILDARALGKDGKPFLSQLNQLAQGYIAAAAAANVAVVNGEVAELGARVAGYGDFNYNWGAGVVWFANENRLLTGHELRVGDELVALREEGFRSNGISAVRKIMREALGEDWHNAQYSNATFGELALIPSKIYTPAIVEMIGGYAAEPQAIVHGVAHITGGGLPEKLGRMLAPSGFGAVIDTPFRPAELMLYCQQIGGVSDQEAYGMWNMGHGMVVATPQSRQVEHIAHKHGIETRVIGEVTSSPGVKICSRGNARPSSWLHYDP